MRVQAVVAASIGVFSVALVPDALAQVDWTQQFPPTFPGVRRAHGLAYDFVRARTLLFGGMDSARLADTWAWDGTSWTQLNPTTSPSARNNFAMTYDLVRNRVLLFGGKDSNNIVLADTWEWDGVDWAVRNPSTSPAPRIRAGVTLDLNRNAVLLFGGEVDANGAVFGDSWEWNGTDWSQLNPATSPSPRRAPAMAYDMARGRVVLFGGYDNASVAFADTWEWDGSTWTQRFPNTVPPAREEHSMVYDHARGRVVMFGGWNRSTYFNDTWEWDGADWQPRTTASAPAIRFRHRAAFDIGRGRVVMFGGADPGNVSLADTWEYAPQNPASYAPFGSGCGGSTGVPSLQLAPFGLPWVGDSVSVQVSNLPGPGTMVYLVAGQSTTSCTWLGANLPYDLTSYGMPGCSALISIEVEFAAVSSGSTHFWTIPICNCPQVIGASFHHQAFVLDAGAGNAAGAVVSNAATGVVGAR